MKLLKTLLFSLLIAGSTFGVEKVVPSISSGTNVVLTWASGTNDILVVLWRRDFTSNTWWTALTTNYPAAQGTNLTTFVHYGAAADCTNGGQMAMADGGESATGTGKTTSPSKPVELPEWLQELKDYQFPAQPWDEDAQTKIAATYPGLHPMVPWDDDSTKFVIESHECMLNWIKAIENGESSVLMSMESGAGDSDCRSSFYLVLGYNEDNDGDGLPDWWEYLTYNTISQSVVTVYPTVGTAYEGGAAGQFTFVLSQAAPPGGVFVYYQVEEIFESDSNTAYAFFPTSNPVFIPAGSISAPVSVIVNDDALGGNFVPEVAIRITNAGPFAFNPAYAAMRIVDNDSPAVWIIATDEAAGEPQGTNSNSGEFTVYRAGSSNALTVSLTVSGTATSGTDFQILPTFVTVPAGSNSVSITVVPLHDTDFEGDETVTLSPVASGDYSFDPSTAWATVTIKEDDLPAVQVVAADPDARESGLNTGTLRFVRTGTTASDLVVRFGVGGTATNGADYATLTNEITIPAGSATADLTVTPLTDSLRETMETVVVTLRGDDLYSIGFTNSATVLLDDAEATQYEDWNLGYLRKAAAPGYPAILEITRTGTSRAEVFSGINFYSNAIRITDFSAYVIGGDIVGTNLHFASNAIKARIEVAPVSMPMTYPYLDVELPQLFGPTVQPVFFHGLDKVVKAEVISDAAVEGNGSQIARVRFSRVAPGSGSLSISATIAGRATPSNGTSPDHNQANPTALSVPASGWLDLDFIGTSDATVEGWEIITASLNPAVQTHVVAEPWTSIGFVRENVANPEILPAGDFDGDGLPDRWELQYGLNPLVKDDTTLDADKDGLELLAEFAFNTNPTNAFSRSTNFNDFAYSRRPAGADASTLTVKLFVEGTGKVNNGQNCAYCHTPVLKVGDYSHYTQRPQLPNAKLLELIQGQSYPIRIEELVQDLPPATSNTGNPTTTARYTAQIFSTTNAFTNFFVIDSQGMLGTNLVWDSSVQSKTGLVVIPRIEVTLPTKTNREPNGLVVLRNENVTLRFFPQDLSLPGGQPRWEYQKLKANGAWSSWQDFNPSSTGVNYSLVTAENGIFRVRANLTLSSGSNYLFEFRRNSDEGINGNFYGPGRKGDLDAFGVADVNLQVNLRQETLKFHGSTAYPYTNAVAAMFGFPRIPPSKPKCNIFVAHRAVAAGLNVPKIAGRFDTYPPLANQWAALTPAVELPNDPYYIFFWDMLATQADPEPGLIIAHQNLTGSGHCGVTDYDGVGIGAGISGTVNKKVNFYNHVYRMRRPKMFP